MAAHPLPLPTSLSPHLGFRHDLPPERLPTGIDSFDLLAGGCPRGRITEITGAPSSGRTSLLYRILSAAAEQGEYTAIVDCGNAFDPVSAATAGVDLDTLVWVRCGGSPEYAMRAADLLIHAGGFGVVALDLADCAGPDFRRIPISYWHRFRNAVEKTPTVLAVMAKEPIVKSCAALAVETARKEASFKGTFPLFTAAKYDVKVKKPVIKQPEVVFSVLSVVTKIA
jgi:hypothetical protein